MPKEHLNCDILVIGSGPGGAITAMLLAQAGRDVILLEEGKKVSQKEAKAYSLEEMDLKYRHGGLTVSMGNPKVSYVEGCCVGGASEINAGLYHRPFDQTVDDWARAYKIKDLSALLLEPFFKANESILKVEQMPGELPAASRLLRDGASKLGWQGAEVPRLWDYTTDRKQSMSETVIPQFISAGGRLCAQTRVKQLRISKNKSSKAICNNRIINFNHVFVCAGAIQTPLLLRQSGIKKNIGNNLRMHPAVRVVAQFDHDINDPKEGVPVYQVSEFKPDITLGGSYSSVPHLALWLAERKDLKEHLNAWARRAIFYALIKTKTPGTVRAMPFIDEPLVTLPMVSADWDLLHLGLKRLEELLKAAGAQHIFHSSQVNLSTIHLFCSCPMGEDRNWAAVDSYGKLHDFDNIYLNDASILPSSPGVNPQATIMALARRNVKHFLQCT